MMSEKRKLLKRVLEDASKRMKNVPIWLRSETTRKALLDIEAEKKKLNEG